MNPPCINHLGYSSPKHSDKKILQDFGLLAQDEASSSAALLLEKQVQVLLTRLTRGLVHPLRRSPISTDIRGSAYLINVIDGD